MQRMPYPPYLDDGFILVLQNQLPFIILLSFMLVAPQIVKEVVLEKEGRLKVTFFTSELAVKFMEIVLVVCWCLPI